MSPHATTNFEPITPPTKPTLYHVQWHSSSRPAQVLFELGLAGSDASPIDVVTVDAKQVTAEPFLAKIHPQGRVPIFHDSDKNLTLVESGAIVEYLLETYDKDDRLTVPPGNPRRPDFLKLIHFGPASGYHICVPILFKFMAPQGNDALRTSDAVFEKKKDEWRTIVVPTLEQMLEKYGGPFLLGNDFTAADAVCGYEIMTVSCAANGELLDAHPKIKAYHEAIKERNTYKKLYFC